LNADLVDPPTVRIFGLALDDVDLLKLWPQAHALSGQHEQLELVIRATGGKRALD
jgi:hypothetical protein